MLALTMLLQAPRILHPKAMFKNLPNILQRQTLNFGIAKIHGDPAAEANRSIETEGA